MALRSVERGRARGAECRQELRDKDKRRQRLRRSMGKKRTRRRHIAGERMARVILHPLAEVGVGMFMAVMVRGRQLVMNFQRRGEGRHREQQAGKQERDNGRGFFLGGVKQHTFRPISGCA